MIRRRETYVQAAENLKAKGLLDDEQDATWPHLDRIHDEGFKAGMTKGLILGAALVMGVVALGWVVG